MSAAYLCSSMSPRSSPVVRNHNHRSPPQRSHQDTVGGTDDPQPCPSDQGDNGRNDISTVATPENCGTNSTPTARKERPSRACAARGAARLLAAVAAEADAVERRPKAFKERREYPIEEGHQQCTSSKPVTPLVTSPPAPLLPRWGLRSMWQLASILNFLHVFRPVLRINVEFSAEEFETALLVPNDTLSDIHIPLLKVIPPMTRMALGRNTWVTVLCRKLRDWWRWVADGEVPVIASHGTESETYNALDPSVRVVILKALCDIRAEQEDIRNYIDDSLKQGFQVSLFRKERVGGDSYGISYWYEDDPVIGHRLYREIRQVESKKVKTKGVQSWPSTEYAWETVATNLDEFQHVSEKLCSSENKSEATVGRRLISDMLPEIEKAHKKRERQLKKQHREALLLNNFTAIDGIGTGRSLRDRKPVTYTFDDYDRSISEAIKETKRKVASPEPSVVTRREGGGGSDGVTDSPPPQELQEEDHKLPDHARRRQRPQRYVDKDFIGDDSQDDDEIAGEAVYDDEYLKKKKRKKKKKQQQDDSSSASEGECSWDERNNGDADDEDDDGDDDDDDDDDEEEMVSLSGDDDSEEGHHRPRRLRREPATTSMNVNRRTRQKRSSSDNEMGGGLRRSLRATQNRIDYRQYEISDSEIESSVKGNNNQSSAQENQLLDLNQMAPDDNGTLDPPPFS